MSELLASENGGNSDLADDLFWLRGKKWDELEPYERQLVIDSQTEQVEDEGPYIPNSAVSSLIGLMHENGIVDAANIDAEFIRTELGMEHIRNPDKIEICLQRLEERRCLDALENGRIEQLPIMLADVVNELELIKKEEEYTAHVEDDINYLTLVGIDPRQLAAMNEQGREKQAEIHSLACDLRSPIARDIAEHYIKRNQKRRPVMRSFEDLYISVAARKHREARQKAELLEGDEVALRRVASMFKEMKRSEEGSSRLFSILENAVRTIEVRELLQAIWKVERDMEAETRNNLFRPEELEWEQN